MACPVDPGLVLSYFCCVGVLVSRIWFCYWAPEWCLQLIRNGPHTLTFGWPAKEKQSAITAGQAEVLVGTWQWGAVAGCRCLRTCAKWLPIDWAFGAGRHGHVINGAWLKLCKAQSTAFRSPGVPTTSLPDLGSTATSHTVCQFPAEHVVCDDLPPSTSTSTFPSSSPFTSTSTSSSAPHDVPLIFMSSPLSSQFSGPRSPFSGFRIPDAGHRTRFSFERNQQRARVR